MDGDRNEYLTIVGVNELDVQSLLPQSVSLQVSDEAGNLRTLSVDVIFEAPGFTFSGHAIDGYLVGSSVWFYPKDPNLQHLSRSVTTDSTGAYQINYLKSEVSELDANDNGIIVEGSFEVVGGIDSTTNRVLQVF